MTPFEQFVNFLVSLTLSPWIFVKILFLIGLLLYLAFALIVIRQVKLMSQTINGALDFPLKLITWIHLGVAIGVFLLALIIL